MTKEARMLNYLDLFDRAIIVRIASIVLHSNSTDLYHHVSFRDLLTVRGVLHQGLFDFMSWLLSNSDRKQFLCEQCKVSFLSSDFSEFGALIELRTDSRCRLSDFQREWSIHCLIAWRNKCKLFGKDEEEIFYVDRMVNELEDSDAYCVMDEEECLGEDFDCNSMISDSNDSMDDISRLDSSSQQVKSDRLAMLHQYKEHYKESGNLNAYIRLLENIAENAMINEKAEEVTDCDNDYSVGYDNYLSLDSYTDIHNSQENEENKQKKELAKKQKNEEALKSFNQLKEETEAKINNLQNSINNKKELLEQQQQSLNQTIQYSEELLNKNNENFIILQEMKNTYDFDILKNGENSTITTESIDEMIRLKNLFETIIIPKFKQIEQIKKKNPEILDKKIIKIFKSIAASLYQKITVGVENNKLIEYYNNEMNKLSDNKENVTNTNIFYCEQVFKCNHAMIELSNY